MTGRSAVAALSDHPTVAAAAEVPSSDGPHILVVVPSAQGLQAYRRSGRLGLAAAWAEHLALEHPPLALPSEWRLLETADPAALARRATERLPRSPHVESSSVDHEGRVHYDLRVPLELAVFRGHFPSVPIVPGVEQVAWAVACAGRHFPVGRFRSLAGVKFRRIVQPADRLHLTLAWSASDSTLSFSYARDARECTLGRVAFDVRDV